MLRIYASLIISFLTVTIGLGQQSYRFRHIGVEDGLSQGSIYHILKDSRGFLWLGTQDGVNRFDGNNVEVFLSGATGESTNVQGIAEDSLGNLWVGSHKGIYQYVRHKNSYVKPVLKNSPAEISMHVFGNRKKEIFVLSEKGLYEIKNSGLDLLSKDLVYSRAQYNNFIAESPSGDLWILDLQKGLKRFSVTEKKVYHYFSDHAKNVFGSPQTFNCIYFDHKGNLWLGASAGLLKFDYIQNKVTTPLKGYDFTKFSLVDIVEDRSGLLWLATEGNGILIFDPTISEVVQHLEHEVEVKNSLRFNEVSKLYIDENNDVFANADPQGLDIITTTSSAFSFYTFGENSLYSLSDYSVRGLVEDADSTIWIGTELGGINRLNLKTGQIKHYTNKNGLPDNVIRFISKDSKNQLWVATLNSLAVFEAKFNRFRKIALPEKCEVTAILPVSEELILLTTDRGLMLLNTNSYHLTEHAYKNLLGGYAVCLDEDSGLIYISNRHRGVNVFKILEGRLVYQDKFLESYHVPQLYKEKGSRFLYACTDRGLVKWNLKENDVARNYSIRDGLHHEYIYSLLPDENGFFWLSTNRGLSRFDPSTERFEFLKEIPPREYNSRASLATAGGNLFFGSTTGLDRIRPGLFSVRNEHVSVHFTNLTLDERGTEYDSVNVDELSTLKLSFANNTITLKFTATDYRSGGLNRYRYFLKNYDQDTIYSGTVGQARYAHLPAGTYEFQLQASDLGGNWVSPTRVLTIHIQPPFWQTWWFRLLGLFIAAVIILFLIRAYLNSRLAAQRLESEKKIFMEKERSRIARDINDGLGSELFGLKLLGQVALSQTKKEDADSYIQKIVEVSKTITEKISEVIWLTDSSQDNTESLWGYIQKNALIYLKPSGIHYHFGLLTEQETYLISGERRHEILNFYKQLFVELPKVCNFKECEVEFGAVSDHLVISIKNAELARMDQTLFTALEKLKGYRKDRKKMTEVLEIPLSV